VVLPDSFRGMGAWRNSTETQQSDHAPKTGPEVKDVRSSAKDGAPESTNVSPPQTSWCGPHPSIERWAEMARQLPQRSDYPVAPNRLVEISSSDISTELYILKYRSSRLFIFLAKNKFEKL